jgi:hypothetical protein
MNNAIKEELARLFELMERSDGHKALIEEIKRKHPDLKIDVQAGKLTTNNPEVQKIWDEMKE